MVGLFRTAIEFEEHGEVAVVFFQGLDTRTFVKSVCFPKSSFHAVAVNCMLETTLGHSKCRHGRVGDELRGQIKKINHPQGAAIKGLLVGE